MHYQRGTIVKSAFFLLALTGILVLAFADANSQTGKLVGVPVISRHQWESLFAECSDYGTFEAGTVYWQNESVPYDKKSGNIYLPQSRDAQDWAGTLTGAGENVRLYFLENPDVANKAYCLENNIGFELAVIIDDMWTQTNVVFTGMPAVCIWGDAEESVLSYMHVLDPDNLSGEGDSLWLRCRFRPRGASSLVAPDPSYRLWLCDESDAQIKKNLFGIRKDEDWILNGFYFDPLLMREKISYQLWEDINKLETEPVKSSSITYVELFLNDEYRGIYGLMPRVDAKQTALKDGAIYKIKSWQLPTPEVFAAAEGKDELVLPDGGILATMVFPNESGSWEPFRAYCDFYASGDVSILKDAGLSLDLENVIAYNLFNVLIQGADNYWKNQNLIFRAQERGGMVVTMSPWDMDIAFGNLFQFRREPEKMQEARTTPGPLEWSWIYAALEEMDAQYLFELSQMKWQTWKNAGISAEYLSRMADAQLAYLKGSGALGRSSNHSGYHLIDYDVETERMKGWIGQRFKQIDRYFADN